MMRYFEPYTLNVSGKLLEVDSPIVMGILNATPDSFYSGSRCDSDEAVRMRVRQIVSEGGRIIAKARHRMALILSTTSLQDSSTGR